MIENGSRKTAPPDTARVKVHRYNLKQKNTSTTVILKEKKDFNHICLFFYIEHFFRYINYQPHHPFIPDT